MRITPSPEASDRELLASELDAIEWHRGHLAAETESVRRFRKLEDEIRQSAVIARTVPDALDPKAAEILESVANLVRNAREDRDQWPDPTYLADELQAIHWKALADEIRRGIVKNPEQSAALRAIARARSESASEIARLTEGNSADPKGIAQ